MIHLEPFSPQDIDELMSWIKSEEEMIIWAGTRFTWPLDHSQIENYMTRRLANNIQYVIFKAIDLETKKMVGHIEIASIDLVNKSATLVHVLVKPEFRNQGYGSEMVKQALEISFNYLKLHRIDLIVFDFNQNAIACYQKQGFVLEGTMREAKWSGKVYWSMCLMSILKPEWEAMREREKQ